MDAERYREAERTLWRLWDVAPEEHRVRLPRLGTEVRVLEVGDAAAPPAVFLHGASVAATSWIDLAAGLRGDLRCLLLDRPGCGLSDPLPAPPGVAGMPVLGDDLLVDVLDALDVARAHVVSNSMGGYFALRGAAAHPDRVDRVLHLGWALGAPPARLAWFMRAATLPGLSGLMARVPVGPAAVRAMLRRVGLADAIASGAMPPEAIAWNVALSNHTDTRLNEYRLASGVSLRRQIERLALSSALLGRIAAPVHLVFGTGDPFGTPETMRALAAAIPNGTIDVLEGAGHAPWLDDLERATATARAFLAGPG